jgi:hypothetical protein
MLWSMPCRHRNSDSPALAAAPSFRRAAVLVLAGVVTACSSDGPTAPSTFTLTVDKSGLQAANAVVTSSPAGIECGESCSASFEVGTVVTLTTTAAAGARFDGWGGAAGCTGTDACTITLEQNATVTASYRGLQVALSVGSTSCLRNEGEVGEALMTRLQERGHTGVFSAASGLDEIEEISEYDVIVIGGPGASCAQPDVAGHDGIIEDYVRSAGGGVVASGWYLHQSWNAPNLDDLIPMAQSPGGLDGPRTVTPVGDSPITAGLGPFEILYFLPHGGGIRAGATALATSGTTVVGAKWEVDAGRTVFLGPLFLEAHSVYANQYLLDGSQPASLEIFMRAIEWAGKAR